MSALLVDVLTIPGAVCIRVPELHGIVVPFGVEEGDALLAWIEAQPTEPVSTLPEARIRRVRIDRSDLQSLPRCVSRQLDLLF